MADLPAHHYIEVSAVADVVRLAAAGFIYNPDEMAFSVSWFGYRASDDGPSRTWSVGDDTVFEDAEGEPTL